MWIELKIVISHPTTLKMLTSIDREFLARALIALFAPRAMLIYQQKFLQISAARMLLCSSLGTIFAIWIPSATMYRVRTASAGLILGYSILAGICQTFSGQSDRYREMMLKLTPHITPK